MGATLNPKPLNPTPRNPKPKGASKVHEQQKDEEEELVDENDDGDAGETFNIGASIIRTWLWDTLYYIDQGPYIGENNSRKSRALKGELRMQWKTKCSFLQSPEPSRP